MSTPVSVRLLSKKKSAVLFIIRNKLRLVSSIDSMFHRVKYRHKNDFSLANMGNVSTEIMHNATHWNLKNVKKLRSGQHQQTTTK